MLTSEPNSGQSSRTPSILDSPTLARVERARLRSAAPSGSGGHQHHDDSLERVILQSKQSLLVGTIPIASMTGPIKRGLLWQQRDRLFSRWKERFFVLTRDYLHCFKRSSGSISDRISDMGQFMFKVKLVDVEKVEWLNRRSYSVIGLCLGREGRVLLRCDVDLEEWFEFLEECTLLSKERRRTLKMTQGSRSRASLAAPPSHASLQANNFGLGCSYSSALDDWLVNQNYFTPANPFLFSDSVPDLSAFNNENPFPTDHSTNYSPSNKIPYSVLPGNANLDQTNIFYGSPRRIVSNNYGRNNIDEEDETQVQLRFPRRMICNNENRNEETDHMYRKPNGPNGKPLSDMKDMHSTCDSVIQTPPSNHRPNSYRDVSFTNQKDLGETIVNFSQGSMLESPAGSFCAKRAAKAANINISNVSRYSVQDKILRCHTEEGQLYQNEFYDPNQNRCYKLNETVCNDNSSEKLRERYQHPALVAIINEAQGMKFRDRSYSDCQQCPKRSVNNNPSSTPRRTGFLGTTTRV